MVATISQRELRNDNADIMRRVERGESFVVTRNGVPIARVVPHRDTAKRRFVPVEDVVRALAGLGDWGSAEFDREQAALDAAVDDAVRDPWERTADQRP